MKCDLIHYTLTSIHIFKGNISVQKPVVNICGMAHPGEICRCLDEERKNANSNDGLYSRFLICMPKPEFRDADVNGEILPNTPNLARYIIIFI